eukprot:scaffold22018_cov39-Cyclotella_meneghiniana.AAC.2
MIVPQVHPNLMCGLSLSPFNMEFSLRKSRHPSTSLTSVSFLLPLETAFSTALNSGNFFNKSFLSFLAISALRFAASFASPTSLSHSSRVNSGVRSKVRDGKVLLGDRNRMKKIMTMPSSVRMFDRV